MPWALEPTLIHVRENKVSMQESSYGHWPYGEDFGPFPGCWVSDQLFPTLPIFNENRRPFGGRLSARKLLHSDRKRFVTGAHGELDQSEYHGTRTEVDWSLRLRRIG